jgi:gliding motility-associated-like protein
MDSGCHNQRLFLLGNTNSPGLATPCAYNEENLSIYTNTAGTSPFLALFTLSGQPEYITYFGGKYFDYGTSVATAQSPGGLAIYFSGNTYSPANIATSGSYKSILGSQLSIQHDAFLAKFLIASPKEIIIPCFTSDSIELKAYDTSAGNYLWNNGATTYSTWVKTSGTYFVSYDKEGGCPGTDTFLVSIYPMPLLTVQNGCVGAGKAKVAVQEGNDNIYTYKWSKIPVGLIVERASDRGDDLSGLLPGNYTLQILASGCDTTIPFTIEAFPEVDLTACNDTLIAAGNSIQLWASGAVQYSWEPEQWLDDPGSATPIASPVAPITYTVTGYNAYGCKAIETVHIDINEGLFVPNAFSPNGDGLNDEFNIGNIGYHKLIAFRVFNRWGEEVFSTTTPRQGWKGTHKGKPADSGVYHYYISIFDSRGEEKSYKGDVTLVR